MPCGISLNVSNMGIDIVAKASSFLGLAGMTGLPIVGIAATVAKLLPNLTSLSGLMNLVLPALPIAGALTSLRDQMTSLVSAGVGELASGLAGLTSQFGGITSLAGYANIDLGNLANSALSLAANFDPCSFAESAIPNVYADASGALSSMANSAPYIGEFSFPDTSFLSGIVPSADELTSFAGGALSSVTSLNASISSLSGFTGSLTSQITNITGGLTNQVTGILPSQLGEVTSMFQSNIGVYSGLSDSIQVLASGKMILRTKDSLISAIKDGIDPDTGLASVLFDEDGEDDLEW